MPRAVKLPTDIETLQRLVLERTAALEAAQALLLSRQLEIAQLKLQIARLRRLQFGRSSEQLNDQISQLEFKLEELESQEATLPMAPPATAARNKSVRRPLPAHLPRERVVHEPSSSCACPQCGGALRVLGEDVAEMLEYVPEHWKVIRHVRPKYSCARCEQIVQAPAPSRPIERGLAGPGLLAHVLVSKYCDHLPLYRQSQIYAREGIELDRSTLAEWVGGASALMQPLVDALGEYVLGAEKLHADDTPVPVLAPGTGKTKQGRLWSYVRDDRPAGSTDPPAVFFRYSPDRKGKHPCEHLNNFHGILQADGYAGFNGLYDRPVHPLTEAACWAHARRKFYDLFEATKSPIAQEALQRIGALYAIEEQIRGRAPDERRRVREQQTEPLLADLHRWLLATVRKLSKKSDLGGAIHYALARWQALCYFCRDGRVEIDNNAAERELRAVALGRKNYLFAGADCGGERAAAIYSFIGTAKLNGLDPEAYLRLVLDRIAEHPSHRIEELLPWNVRHELAASHALAA
jgi:transposase